MLAEEVHLSDWNISVFGKAEAIRETVKNFAEAESIEIHILALYESTNPARYAPARSSYRHTQLRPDSFAL